MGKIEKQIDIKVEEIINFIKNTNFFHLDKKENFDYFEYYNVVNDYNDSEDYVDNEEYNDKISSKEKLKGKEQFDIMTKEAINSEKQKEFYKLRKELIDVLLSDEVMKKISEDDMVYIEPLKMEVFRFYYQDMLSRFLLKDTNSVKVYCNKYKDKQKSFWDYLKDKVFKMYKIDTLAIKWAGSLDKGLDNKMERKIWKEKIIYTLYDSSAKSESHEYEEKIRIYYFWGMKLYEYIYTNLIVRLLDENSKNRYQISRNSSFSMCLYTLLRKQNKEESEKRNDRIRMGLTGRGPNKKNKKTGKANKEISVQSLIQVNADGKEYDLLEKYYDDLSESYREEYTEPRVKMNHDEILIEVIDLLYKSFNTFKSEAQRKKKNVFRSAFTFGVIKNTEKEKINGEMDKEGECTKIYLHNADLIIKLLSISFIIMLKGGENENYLKVDDVIRRSIVKRGVILERRGERTKLIQEYFSDFIEKSSVRFYLTEYNKLVSSIERYILG